MKNIILSRTDRIGDVILTAASFEPLRAAFPEANIRILVRPELSPLLANNTEGVEPVECPPGLGAKGFHGSRIARWKSYFQSNPADAIVFLHPDNDLQIAAALARIPRRLGYRKQVGHWALNEKIPYRRHLGLKHEAHCNFDLLKILGCTAPPDLRPLIHLASPSVLPEELRETPFAVFHPDAFGVKPRWPAKHYADLAGKLHRHWGWKIVLIGSEASPEILSLFENSSLPRENWSDRRGKDNLLSTAHILSQARLVVSRDSGPAHLAAAVETPLVCLMGQCDPIHSPARWAPLGPKVRTLISDLPARRGESREERWGRCFHAISPQEVFRAACELIDPGTRPSR